MLLVGSVFFLFVFVILVFVTEADVEPVGEGREQVVVVPGSRFLVELVPHVHLVIAAELTLRHSEQAELCYM